ncbi:MAG TPA: DUF3667 domain-containing protein [Puia sp.]|nr:DUF3667 domain-containing protein [Puia sp.]
MSHLKERKEKNCLNCKATLYGRYCHVCGQENLEPKETVWHLVQHFFNDITHFDGKFFATVKYLLRKPGFLSLEYVAGRRMSYLNPIRMYVFTSALFFIILFAIKDPKDMVNMKETPDRRETLAQLREAQTELQKELAGDEDRSDSASTRRKMAQLGIQLAAIRKYYGDTTRDSFTAIDLEKLVARGIKDSLPEARQLLAELPQKDRDKVSRVIRRYSAVNPNPTGDENEEGNQNFFGLNPEHFRTQEAYDSSQRAMPDSLRDGWLERRMMHKIIAANIEFRRDSRAYIAHVAENIMHSIPKVLFVSLPLFALILYLMYFRRRKTYYYVDHGIFTIHLYCATFILTMAAILIFQLAHAVGVGWVKVIAGILIFALCVYIVIYLYKAMRGFYRQGRFKTFAKYCLVCLLSFIINSIIFVIFILLSVVSV